MKQLSLSKRWPKCWKILNVKGPNEGRNLNNPYENPINNIQDERLEFILRMSTSLKLMDPSKRGQRIPGLICDRSGAWYVTLVSLVNRSSIPEVFCKNKVFLKFLQNSQENTCATASFSILLKLFFKQLY